MREWIGLVSSLLERHAHHRKHHTSGVRVGFFPRMGIYVCGQCGNHNPISQSGDTCPSCGTGTSTAPVNTGGATPAGGAAPS